MDGVSESLGWSGWRTKGEKEEKEGYSKDLWKKVDIKTVFEPFFFWRDVYMDGFDGLID